MHKTAPSNNKDLAKNVSRVKVEKFCSEVRVLGPACTLETPRLGLQPRSMKIELLG